MAGPNIITTDLAVASPPNGYPQAGQQTGPPSILDQFGKRISTFDDFAIPSVISFSSILGSSYRTFWHGLYDEAMRHSREDALVMRRDAFLMALLRERQRSVARLRWHIEGDDQHDPTQIAVCDTLTKIVKRMPRFRRFLMSQLEALWYGRYGSQFRFDWDQIDGMPVLACKAHVPLNGDKIGYTYDGVPYVLVHVAEAKQLGLDYLTVSPDEITDPTHAGLIYTTVAVAVSLRGTWRERFQIHQHEIDDADYFEAEQADAIHGVGIRSRVFWLDWLRREYISWLVDFMERVGLGVTIYYYDGSNPKSKDESIKLAKEQNRRSVIVWPRWPGEKGPQGGGVERLETPVSGVEALVAMQGHIEDHIERYVIGQQASSRSETSGLGTHDTDLQAETKGAITELDADNLAETITGSEAEPGLLHVLKKWSFPQGVDFPVYFKFDVTRPQPEKALESVKAAWEMGVSFVANEVRALTGLSDPQEGDDILEGQTQQPEGFGNGFGGDGGDENGFGEGPEGGPAASPGDGAREPPASRQDHQRQHYAKGECKWITIGAKAGADGKKHGGTPVCVQGGRIVKGHPRLTGRKIGALSETPEEAGHRSEVHRSKGHARATWGKKAKAEGVKPQALHQLAAELIAHDKEYKSDLTRLLQDARKQSKTGGEYLDVSNLRQRAASGNIDASHIKGFDLLTRTMRNSFPELLGDDEQEAESRLFDLLAHGNPEPMSEDEAYTQAFDHLMEHRHEQEPEPVPFQRQRDWIADHESRQSRHYKRLAKAYLEAKEERQ
jgi:hypothetical protein